MKNYLLKNLSIYLLWMTITKLSDGFGKHRNCGTEVNEYVEIECVLAKHTFLCLLKQIGFSKT